MFHGTGSVILFCVGPTSPAILILHLADLANDGWDSSETELKFNLYSHWDSGCPAPVVHRSVASSEDEGCVKGMAYNLL